MTELFRLRDGATLAPPSPREHAAPSPPGAPFFAKDPAPATLQLSFATADVAQIEEGMARRTKELKA